MTRDIRDVLLIAGFFLGYAAILAFLQRLPKTETPLDGNRLSFWRGQRGTLIDEENMVGIDGD